MAVEDEGKRKKKKRETEIGLRGSIKIAIRSEASNAAILGSISREIQKIPAKGPTWRTFSCDVCNVE